MSMAYVRRAYGVPAKRGMRVREAAEMAPGIKRKAQKEGIITRATCHVVVRLNGDRHRSYYHPTDLVYLDGNGEVLWPNN